MIFQAHLDTFAIFVNNADFYVNAIMSTFHPPNASRFIVFDFGTTSSGPKRTVTLNIDFARIPALFAQQVNGAYPLRRSVQVNDTVYF